MSSQDYVFRYDISKIDSRILKDVIPNRITIRDLISYNIKSKLNNVSSVVFTVNVSELYSNSLIVENDILMPILNIPGIITRVKNENNTIEVEASELAWHLTRRKFTDGTSQEYEATRPVNTLLDLVIASANMDMPFDWIAGEDIPTDDVGIKANYKNHLEVLQLIAKNSSNDLWFDNHKIFIGTKGKTVNVTKDKYFYDLLASEVDLDRYANIVKLVGKDKEEATAMEMTHDFKYNYEKVIVNNNAVGDDNINDGAERLLKEFNVANPQINIRIENTKLKEYSLSIGDVLRVVNRVGDNKISGFYRIMQIVMNDKNAKLALEYSSDGKFSPRLVGVGDAFSTMLNKLRDLELI